MKLLFTLLFSFLVSFQVFAQQIYGSTTARVGQCTTYSLGNWGETCITVSWQVSSGGTALSTTNTPSIEVCWTTPGTHTISASDACGKSAFIQVTVAAASCLPIAINSSTSVACVGQTVNLSTSGYDSYSWSGANGNGNTATFTPTSVGLYTISVTGTSGSCSESISTTVQVNPLPTISPALTIQTGQSAVLCASGGTAYSWSNGATSSCITIPPSNTPGTIPYSVQVTTPCGITTLSTSITVEGQLLSIYGSTTAQVGECTTYSLGNWGEACVTASWQVSSGGTALSTTNTPSIEVCWTTPGTHTISASDACGKSAFIQVTVAAASCPPIAINSSTSVACIGQTVNLSVSGYSNYFWSGAIGSGNTATFTPTSVGSYTISVTGTSGSCSESISTTVQVNPLPTISPALTIQTGQSAVLCATGGTAYSWSNGATSSCITIPPSNTPGTIPYSVQVTTPCGITTLSTSITVEGQLLSMSANNTVCLGQTIQASVIGGTPPYSFSSNASIVFQDNQSGSITVNPSTIGTVSISVTDGNGNSTSTTSSVEEAPSFAISGAGAVCSGESSTLSIVGGNANSYSWTISSGSGVLSNSTGTSTTLTPTSGFVVVQATGSNGTCSYSTTQGVSVSSGQVDISPRSTTLCKGSAIILYGSGADNYNWFVDGNYYGSGFSIQLLVTANTTVTLTGTDNCGNTSSSSIDLSVYPAIEVEVSPESATFKVGEDVTFVASSSQTLTYRWYDEDRIIQLAAGATFTQSPTENTTYTLVASNSVCETAIQVTATQEKDKPNVFCPPSKDQTFEPIAAETYSIPNPDYGKNYIRSEAMLTPVKTQAEIDALPINHRGKAVAFGFFDGLGRAEQNIQVNASPTRKNIIQHIEYDELGRVKKDFLPHTGRGGINNPFQRNAGAKQANFYLEPTADYATTTIPYSEKIFENSPYSRVLEQAAQGEAYSLQSGNTIKASERPNTVEDNVHLWYYEEATARLRTIDFYQNGELWVNQTQDEHGTTTWQFTDKLGRLILQRTQMETGTNPVETYYVYHRRFLTKPQFIIQPKGLVALYGKKRATLNAAMIRDWTFSYQYDGRGRVHKKWIPGQRGENTFIYDERDRMILAQTPNQINKNEWIFTKYDVLNRPIMSGLYTSTKTVAELQITIETQDIEVMYENREINIAFGYSNKSFPIIEDTENILSVIYYDGYCNIFDEEAQPESFPFAANPLVESEEQAATVRGLTTVSKTRVLNRRGEWLSSVIYYDEYHRAVQTQTQQMGGRWDVMTNKYDFSGKVLRTHQRHRSKTDPIVVNQSFVYDHAGRLTKTYHKVNQKERILLSQVAYNEVGQVKGKGLHGDNPLQNINFKYNIRGWLTHINDLANVEKGNSSSLLHQTLL